MGQMTETFWKRVLYYVGCILAFSVLILGVGVGLPFVLANVSHWALGAYLVVLAMVGVVALAMYLAKTE